MKIVNINDIEDLILTKHEIDLMLMEDNIIDQRTTINEFLIKYATPDNIYVYNGINIPFKFIEIHDNKYLFVTDYDEQKNDILTAKIKLLKYDMNNLVEISYLDMLNNTKDNINDDFIIIGNKYYK